MSGLGALRCFKCGATDGRRGAIVLEATDLEVIAHAVPVGVGLCAECAYMTEEQEEQAAFTVEALAKDAEFAARRQEIAEELEADLDHEAKEWASWSNKFGGW